MLGPRKPKMSTLTRSCTSLGLFALVLTAPLQAQTSFNLIADQTPIRNQGNRTTCITFAALAALEAAYARAGHRNLDMSEEFQNYVGKLFWLHTDWNTIPTANTTENQVGAFGGGGGTGHVRFLCSGMRVPDESRMPYRPAGYNLGSHPSWQDPFWDNQRNANTFNLDRNNLPREALTSDTYYRGSGFTTLSNPRSATDIEATLRRSREVVWDFFVSGDRSGSIWRADPNLPNVGAHSMVIIGYDRTHPDPRQHYFIVKNSWGATSNPGGFTRISYDYLQYGYSAACFTGVRTPAPWQGLAFVGRHNLCFDGWRGTLDITHLPGLAQIWLDEAGVNVADRRVGTFYDTSGTAHRVNGQLVGNKLYFWFKGGFPNMRWDDQRESSTGVGRGFNYFLVDEESGRLAGFHQDNPGLIPNPAWGGYAIQPSTINGSDGYLQPNLSGAGTTGPEQYLGTWDVQCANVSGRMTFEARDDTLVPQSLRGTWAGLRAHIIEGSQFRRTVTALVKISSPRNVDLSFTLSDGRQVTTDCFRLSHQRGVLAGAATVAGQTEGIYLVRTGPYLGGTFGTFGQGCGRPGNPVTHSFSGNPVLGSSVLLIGTGEPSLPGAIHIGTSRTGTSSGVPLPFDLSVLGATGCQLYVEPQLSLPLTLNRFGGGAQSLTPTSPALIGVQLYTQFLQADPMANSAGVAFSNGGELRFGG